MSPSEHIQRRVIEDLLNSTSSVDGFVLTHGKDKQRMLILTNSNHLNFSHVVQCTGTLPASLVPPDASIDDDQDHAAAALLPTGLCTDKACQASREV